MAFELLKQHLIEDDAELDKIYGRYRSGEITSGEVKDIACEKIVEFMKKLNAGIKEARTKADELNFVKPDFSDD